MESALARHHQLHGVQPVLPVADVAAAAAWFCDTLGFQIDLLHGEPPVHGRVRLGDSSFGDPIYIHLSKRDGPLPAGSEIRLHVGHDIDGLHAHALAHGARVLSPPADQPWGLREFVLEAPGGHRLVLGAEAMPSAVEHKPRTVIVAYKPNPGSETALLDEVRRHVPTLQRLGLATMRAPFVMQATGGVLVEVFEWASAEAIARAHGDPEVHAMWARFGALCSIEKLVTLPETANLFAEFEAL